MSQIVFASKGNNLTTPIPDSFIYGYLPKASGIFCKVYIYTYSIYYHASAAVTTADIAAALNLTEPDLFEAYSELSRAGLMHFRRTKDSCQISFPPTPTFRPTSPDTEPSYKSAGEYSLDSASASPAQTSPSQASSYAPSQASSTYISPSQASSVNTKIVRCSIETRPTYSAEELSIVARNKQVADLFDKATVFLGGSLSAANMSLLYSFYDYYRMPIDEICVLLDYLAETGHNSLRYMETIVNDWTSHGINTAELAKAHIETEKRYLPILKAMNRSLQGLTQKDKDFMETWLVTLEMPVDVICEAAKRTLLRTDPASFNYMDSCIKRWHGLGYKTLDLILSADPDRRQQYNQSKSTGINNMINSGEDYESAALAWENRI